MAIQVSLNDAETELILMLLKAQRRELPVEIHHSDTFEFRHDLREQAKIVRQLIERLEVALPKCCAPVEHAD